MKRIDWKTAVIAALAAWLTSSLAASVGGIGGGGGIPGYPPGNGASGLGQGSDLSSTGGSVKPLRGVIRLKRALRRGASGPRPSAHVSLAALKQRFAQFSTSAGAYESEASTMALIELNCSRKSYSVQDQMAAGCVATEPLSQCMDKLYRHCLAGGGPTATAAQFRQSAKAAAAEARTLSGMLQHYAEQAAGAAAPAR